MPLCVPKAIPNMLLAERVEVPIRRPMWHRTNRLRGGPDNKTRARIFPGYHLDDPKPVARIMQTTDGSFFRYALGARTSPRGGPEPSSVAVGRRLLPAIHNNGQMINSFDQTGRSLKIIQRLVV